MKPRNIERHLRQKVDDWLASIDDEAVHKLAADGTIVMGGAIASLLLDEKVNDYDLYFRNKETCWAVANCYVERFKENPPPKFRGTGEQMPPIEVHDDDGRIKIVVKSAGIAGESESEYAYFEGDPDPTDQEAFLDAGFAAFEAIAEEDEKPYRPVFLSANAITLSDKVQLVTRFYGSPTDIRGGYDFVHVTNFWTSWSGKLTLRKDALLALLTKELKVINGGTLYPFAAICRIRKFLRRGFHITAGEILKLCFAISELDLRDYTVLEEQLTGVDWAYFVELLAFLDTHKDECLDEDGKLKTPYVLDLIDRML